MSNSPLIHESSPHMSDLIVLTPFPMGPGHNILKIVRIDPNDWSHEMRANANHIAEGDNTGIVINRPANPMDNAKEPNQKPSSAKMSFKVFLINSETGKLSVEHRTLRFWIESTKRATFSRLAQAYFCQLIGSKPDDDFPKNYVAFIMKLMRLLKTRQFHNIAKIEVELRQLADDQTKPPSRSSSINGSQGSAESNGRRSPLTSQKVLDIIESSYPNPISIREICSTTLTEESIVRQLLEELTGKEKINSTDDGQHYTRTLKPIDTKVNMVKQMPKVVKAQQPVIAIITAQYCEKLAVDSMISDKETFVRYRTMIGGGSMDSNQPQAVGVEQSSANYVYTLGNIGDHRVVSTKLTSIGHSRGALIAAGNATTRLLGTFPELEYVFLIGCGGGVVNYTDFASHVRLGDVVVSHVPGSDQLRSPSRQGGGSQLSDRSNQSDDYVYVHCQAKQQQGAPERSSGDKPAGIPVSYSIHKNLKRASGLANGGSPLVSEDFAKLKLSKPSDNKDSDTGDTSVSIQTVPSKPLEYDECHFRLWRPVKLELQDLAQKLWQQGLENSKHRIWDYYIDEGIKSLKQQDIDARRPEAETDKLFMSIGLKDTIEVNHPEAAEDEIDLRREGRPMCHFGPVGSGRAAISSDSIRQRMITEFGLRAFDSEFDPVVESIYGNCKESYIMIRGISDYRDGRKKKEWQQYSALVAAAFMKSIIVNLKPLTSS